jgi:hypothetical protein
MLFYFILILRITKNWKNGQKKMPTFYMSTISSHFDESSNSSNSSNLKPSQLTPPNLTMVYSHFKDKLANCF